jgi:7-cyano-7-deazaguanine synthase in queuosine biosynthesis
MSHEVLAICGGASLPGERSWLAADRVVLDAPLSGGNLHLRIEDVRRPLAGNLSDVMADLVELATYVYCADQAVRRGSKGDLEYGAHWRRHFRLRVPVRCPHVWRERQVDQELRRTLGFLSDDEYEFDFIHGRKLPGFSDYLPNLAPAKGTPEAVESVVLFSGGLDSLTGAVEEILGQGRRVALVSHRSVSKVDARQQELARMIAARVSSGRSAPLHVSVWANKSKRLGREYTQRTRSFLFGAFGVAVASLLGLDTVRFYENGVVSLNLPVCAQVLGGRASRTTHPQALARMQSLFSRLLGRSIRIENPFLWKTKTDVVAALRQSGHADLAAHTVSCAHTWETTRDTPHCGKCSQCIDRRLAAGAAGLSPAEDPPARYKLDVFRGAFAGVEHQTMAERVVGTAMRLEGVQSPALFVGEYGEASRAVSYLGMEADLAARRMFELYQRQAAQVREALRAAATATPPGGTVISLTSMLGVAGLLQQNVAMTSCDPDGADGLLTEDDLQLLEVLSKARSTVLILSLADNVARTRKIVSAQIQALLRRNLVEFPRGPRKGVAISAHGRRVRAAMAAAALPTAH